MSGGDSHFSRAERAAGLLAVTLSSLVLHQVQYHINATQLQQPTQGHQGPEPQEPSREQGMSRAPLLS